MEIYENTDYNLQFTDYNTDDNTDFEILQETILQKNLSRHARRLENWKYCISECRKVSIKGDWFCIIFAPIFNVKVHFVLHFSYKRSQNKCNSFFSFFEIVVWSSIKNYSPVTETSRYTTYIVIPQAVKYYKVLFDRRQNLFYTQNALYNSSPFHLHGMLLRTKMRIRMKIIHEIKKLYSEQLYLQSNWAQNWLSNYHWL